MSESMFQKWTCQRCGKVLWLNEKEPHYRADKPGQEVLCLSPDSISAIMDAIAEVESHRHE